MAKMSPQQIKAEAENLKALFGKAKVKEHNCALILSDDGVMFHADHKLPADKLWLHGRKQKGATNRGVSGKMKIQGAELHITCEEAPPGNFELKLKQYLSQLGLKFRPVLILPETEGGKTPEAATAEVAAKPPEAGTAETPASETAPARETAPPEEATAAAGGNQGSPEAAAEEGISPERRKSRAQGLAGLEAEVDALLATL